MPRQKADINRLQVGSYVQLPLRWMDHPFLFNAFLIRTESQLETLRRLGLKQVWYDPEKSEAPLLSPLPGEAEEGGEEEATEEENPTPDGPLDVSATAMPLDDALMAEKRARMAINREKRKRLQNCETRYRRTMASVKGLMQNLLARPREAVEEADHLVSDMVGTLLAEKEYVVHLMAEQGLDEQVYYHALNVSMLSMMVARECRLSEEEMRYVGMGALFHDIGKARLPGGIIHKRGELTPSERALYERHVHWGEEMADQMGNLAPEVVEVIARHHELLDGSGFPGGLDGPRIGRVTRIVTIANTYDNLCNPNDPARALSPYEALSFMFKKMPGMLDEELLAHFVRCLGVYPPGSIVQLSNDVIGLVMSFNAANLLAPVIKVYDPEVPKEEAYFVDLMEEPGVSIERSIRPADLPREIYVYLNPRRHVNYYFDTAAGSTPEG